MGLTQPNTTGYRGGRRGAGQPHKVTCVHGIALSIESRKS